MNHEKTVDVINGENNTALLPITLTSTALKYVKEKIHQRQQGIGIRLAVKSAGCSGLKYVFDYVDEINSEDYCFLTEENALSIYVDKKSYPFIKGTEIDLVGDKFNSHLVFNNPNVQNACGCGESFSIENPEL